MSIMIENLISTLTGAVFLRYLLNEKFEEKLFGHVLCYFRVFSAHFMSVLVVKVSGSGSSRTDTLLIQRIQRLVEGVRLVP